jgi:BolA protein
MLTRQDRLRAVLTAAFVPSVLEVVDDSSRHAGHMGASPSGETHYSIHMVSEAFAGQSRLSRSRAVHAALDEEFRDGMHALSLVLRSPAEQP